MTRRNVRHNGSWADDARLAVYDAARSRIDSSESDPLAPARGCLIGLALSALFWIPFGIALYWVVNR